MGKDRKCGETVDKEEAWELKLANLNPIAKPLATRKLAKRLYKLIRKVPKGKLQFSIKDVQRSIKHGKDGIVVLAGDTHPIEVMCHIPILCEDNSLAYCYLPCKEDIGTASGTKRMITVLMIQCDESYQEIYEECYASIKALPLPI